MSEDIDLIPLYGKAQDTVPTGLTATCVNSEILLNWNPPVNTTSVANYNVYYSYDNQFIYHKHGDTPYLNYIVSGLALDRTYHFAVTSTIYDQATFAEIGFILGQGMFGVTPLGSNIVAQSGSYTAPDPAYTPINVNISGYDNTSIQLSWDPPLTGIQNVSGFRIWKTQSYSSVFTPIGSTKNTWYIDSGLDKANYYYRVTSLY